MSYRSLNSTLQTSLIDGDSYGYAHLIKFEKPIPATELTYSDRTKPSNRAINYAYLTDGAYDIEFDDGSVDASGTPNGDQNYLANKVLNVGTSSETIQAKATGMNLVLAADAVGISINGTFAFTSTDITAPSGTTWTDQGFQEGDTIKFTGNGANNGAIVRIDTFTNSNTKAKYTALPKDDGTVSSVAAQSATYTVKYHSPEINALTTLKSDPSFSSYLNREVFIYRAHINPSTGAIIGGNDGVFLLFKGIITGGKLQEDPLKGSKITWNLTSHWGDFVQIKGRNTSDAGHRGLNTGGVTDVEAVFRPEYASDLGFIHSEQAVNITATYQVMEQRMGTRQASGFFNGTLFGMDEAYTYEVPVDKDVDLEFNLQARYLPVVYGVQKVGSIPFFADGAKENAKLLFVASALCEGPVHSIMDMHVEDEPLVCMNSIDAAERRGSNSEANVVCFGRADKGDVLRGNNHVVDPATLNARDDTLNQINAITNYINTQGGYANVGSAAFEQLARLRSQLGAYDDAIANFTGNAGLTHENKFNFSSPMDTEFTFHAGRSDQEADTLFAHQAGTRQFKLQSMYHTDKPGSEYWGINHRVLDTCYIAQKFTINAEEFTIPKTEYVIKGRVLDCYNYDRSYYGNKTFNSNTTHADFLLGDEVKLFKPDSTRLYDGSNTNEVVQIIDKFSFYNDTGTLEYRYRFSKNLQLAEDNSNLSADLTHFYMEHKTDNSKRWYFATHDGAVEKADASGLIRNVPLPSQTIFNNTDNSAVDFSAATMTLNLSSGSTTINTKILTGLPTGNATLAMGKYLAFYIQYGTGDEYRYFALPILSYNSGNGTVTFDVEQQPLVNTIDNVLTQAKQAIAAGVSDAKWNIVVSDVVKLGGSLDSTDDKYNTSNLVIKHIAGNGNIIRRVKIIDDYDASEALVRVREPYTWTTFPQSTGPGRSGSTYNFDIEGSVDIDVAGFNSIAGKGADRRVSINPAIQLLDYLTNERYGKGLDKDKDLDLESFLAAARVCDTRSDVTMVVKTSTLTTTPTDGAVYKYPATGSPILFQGTVKGTPVTYDVTGLGDNSRTNFTQIVFTNVIGQLGRKWNDYRTYEASRHVIYYNGSAFTASSTGTMDETARDSAITNNLLTSVSLTRVGNTGNGDNSIAINVEKKFGNAGNGNPVVRKYSPVDAIFNAMGYSLYDGDDCKYWKLLGWDEQEQRNVTRHQTNITLNTSEPVFANINVLLSQFNGMLRYGNGKYSLAIRQKAPDDAHFTSFPAKVINEEDIIGSISIDDGTSKKKLNQISANIIDPSLRFGGRGITFSNSDYVKQDRGIKKEGNYSSPGISNYFNARIAVKQQLDESRFGLTVKFTIDSAGYLLQAGEIIRINYSRFNWTDKEYRIQSLNFAANGTVQVVAREHNDNAYIVGYVDDFQNGDTLDGGSQGGRSFTAPGAPTNGTATTDQAGRVKLTWTNGTEFVPTVQATQVARHPTNVTPNAAGDNVTIIADTQQDNFIDTSPGDFSAGDVSHYYWVRHAYSRNHGSTASVERNKFTAWLAIGVGTAKVTTKLEVEGEVEIEQGGIKFKDNPSGNPFIRAGQSNFDTGTGFFLGRHSSAYKLSVGNSSGNKLTFDGTNLSVTGTITGSAFESGTLKGTHSNAIPTDIFTRSTDRTRPVNSETGGFIDLTTGHFIFGNATKFIAFGPDDDNNDTVGVRGDLIADKLIANTSIETPLLKVGAIQANTIGVAELKEEVFSEIDSRLGNAGGYYDSYETGVSNTDDGYLGTTGTTYVKELTGSANAGYQHKGEKTFLNFSINDAFIAPRASSQNGRSGDDLKITVTLQKADQTSGTPSYSNLATKEMTLTETHLQHATSFTLSDTLSHVIAVGTTGHDVDDYYFYRVVITASTSLSMFREFSSGDSTSGANDSDGTPILFEVREGAIGTTAGNLGSSGDIIHDGDPDTKIVFNDDEIVLQAGGETMATFTESTSDTITLHKDTTVSTNLTVSGNLTVTGTTSTLNTADLTVEDKNIVLNYNASGDTSGTADGAGITIQDAVDASTDASILWNASEDRFDFSNEVCISTGTADTAHFPQLVLKDTNGTSAANQLELGYSGNVFYFKRNDNDGAFHFRKTNNTDVVVFDMSNEKVGIGTASPSTQLHIATPSGNPTIGGATLANARLLLGTTTAGMAFDNNEIIVAGDHLFLQTLGNNDIKFRTNGTEQKMIIKGDGKVGIGNSEPASRLQVEDFGLDTTMTSVSSTSATVVDTFAKATFRTARYTVQITQGTKYQTSDIMAIHDGTTPIATEYAMLETDGILGTLNVAISGDNVQLKVTMAAADAATVKVVRQCIEV